MRKRTRTDRHQSQSPEGGSKVMKVKNPGPRSTEIAKTYEPTPNERATLEAILAARKKSPRAKVRPKKGNTALSLDHPDQRYGHVMLMKMLATADIEFVGDIL
jgi:hypothetical protein